MMLGAHTDHASRGSAVRERGAGCGRSAVLDGNVGRERNAVRERGAVRGRVGGGRG